MPARYVTEATTPKPCSSPTSRSSGRSSPSSTMVALVVFGSRRCARLDTDEFPDIDAPIVFVGDRLSGRVAGRRRARGREAARGRSSRASAASTRSTRRRPTASRRSSSTSFREGPSTRRRRTCATRSRRCAASAAGDHRADHSALRSESTRRSCRSRSRRPR